MSSRTSPVCTGFGPATSAASAIQNAADGVPTRSQTTCAYAAPVGADTFRLVTCVHVAAGSAAGVPVVVEMNTLLALYQEMFTCAPPGHPAGA